MDLRICLLVLCIFFSVGCKEVPLVEDLSDHQARRVVATLSRKGITATYSKIGRGAGKYSVHVPSGEFSRSVRVLDEAGLPEEERGEFLEVFSSGSFLPDSRQVEALRLDHAFAVQLETLIEEIPEVVSARAIVRYHSIDPSKNEGDKRRSTSLVVRLKKDTPESVNEELSRVALSVVPGLASEDLQLSTHYEDAERGELNSRTEGAESSVEFKTFLFGWRVAEDDYSGLAGSLLGLIGLFGLAGGLAGYWFGYIFSHPRVAVSDEVAELRSSPFQLEAGRRDEPRREELPEVRL